MSKLSKWVREKLGCKCNKDLAFHHLIVENRLLLAQNERLKVLLAKETHDKDTIWRRYFDAQKRGN